MVRAQHAEEWHDNLQPVGFSKPTEYSKPRCYLSPTSIIQSMSIDSTPISAMTLEETEWVTRAKAGDERATACLIGRYRARVVRLAARTLHRSGDSEDVAQDAFIQAFRNLKNLKSDEAFSTWLYRIVIRMCIDRSRRFWWSKETPVDIDDERTQAAESSSDTKILVEQLLNKLSPANRATLVLRVVEGLEYEEISKILSIPVGTVRSRLCAARVQFRKLWREASQESEE
jgi:RNA polymerase sigma-70 factor (ECF subfamily)